ncbi:MaoC/PaaZ C-terminal domain-containing protein [Streptomyces sp. NPDC090493]|uniref:MaoC family dehydratase n=1 Tax=Streptomyces sp. NPDC090493 TaxID=3365964 RepID=UPI003826E268
MSLNLDLLGRPTEPVLREWTERDTLLYALAVGAGADEPAEELAFTTENSHGIEQQVVPTFGCVVAAARSPRALGDFDVARLVHAEQSVLFHAPIPPAGGVRAISTLTGAYDKGKAALLVQESTAIDVRTGQPLVTSTGGFFVRGEGGFGGERGPEAAPWELPARKPDHEVVYRTRRDQPLLYRLTGDRNPLHSDPTVAERAGFPRPILHGMCTYGFTCRALLHTVGVGRPSRLRSMSARFSRPVMPGDVLTARVWDEDGRALFQTVNGKGDVVLDRGTAEYRAV